MCARGRPWLCTCPRWLTVERATAQAEGRCASTRTCTTAVQLPRPPRPPLSPELSAIELAGDVSVAAAHCVETHNAPAAVFLLAAAVGCALERPSAISSAIMCVSTLVIAVSRAWQSIGQESSCGPGHASFEQRFQQWRYHSTDCSENFGKLHVSLFCTLLMIILCRFEFMILSCTHVAGTNW